MIKFLLIVFLSSTVWLRTEGFYHNGEKCGPPRLLKTWVNMTATSGAKAILTCPLDSANSCLVDLVEWYKSNSNPGTSSIPRKLLRPQDGVKVFAFDPLMLYIENVKTDHEGWYTCVVGNIDGRDEVSTYLHVDSQESLPRHRAQTTTPPVTTTTTTLPTTTTPAKAPISFQETTSRRTLTPEMAKNLQQVYAKMPAVSYGASRYSSQAGTSGYAPWHDESYFESRTSEVIQPKKVSATWENKREPSVASVQTIDQEIVELKVDQRATVKPVVDTTMQRQFEGSEVEQTRIHLDALNDHLRYIYERLDDVIRRIEVLEKLHRT